MEGVTVKKATQRRLALTTIIVLLITMFLLTACETPIPRIPVVYTYNPGAPFSTNFNFEEDPRRQVKCTIMFEVIDEAAIDELTENNFIIRNAVLSVLGELTWPEVTTERNLDDIAQRLVERVNEDLNSNIDLIIGAYFTEFALA